MAANYLDSLVVQFAIDSKGAVDGAKEVEKAVDSLTDSAQEGGAAAEGAAKSTERAFQRTDQAMRRTGATLKETRQSVEGNNRAIDGSGRSIVETGRKVVKTTERTNKTMDRSREKNVRDAKDMGASQERLAETLGKVRGEAVSLLAIFTAGRGMKEFLSSTTATSAAAGRMAHNLGMSTQDLTAWQTVARESGGTAEGMTGSLQGLVDQFQTISGRTNLTQVFSRIGVNLEDGNGKLRDRTQIMMDLADKFSSMDPTQANSWGRMLGFDQGTINTLERGRKALSGLYAEARRNGITDQQAQAFAQLQQDWVQLTTQSDALGRSILTKLAPALHTILADTSEFVKEHPDLVSGIAATTAAATGLAGVLGTIASIKFGGRLLGLLGSACACGEGGGAGGKKPSAGRSAAKEVAKDAAETAGGEAAAKKAGTSVMRRVGQTALRGAGKALRVAPWIAIPYEILADATPTAKDDTIPRGSNTLRSAVSDTSRFGVFAQSVAKIEGARYNQMGGYNNAYAGKYQMGEGAIQDAARSLHEAVPTQSQFLGDPDMQERYFRAYTGLNEKTLWARSDTFRNASDARKMEILGYAHNQGAGGALKWLKTGVAARDGFGTRADRYANEIHSSFAANGMLNNMQPMIQHAAGPVNNNNTSNTQTIHVDAITVNAHGANPDSVVRAIHHEFGAAATLGHQTATRLG